MKIIFVRYSTMWTLVTLKLSFHWLICVFWTGNTIWLVKTVHVSWIAVYQNTWIFQNCELINHFMAGVHIQGVVIKAFMTFDTVKMADCPFSTVTVPLRQAMQWIWPKLVWLKFFWQNSHWLVWNECNEPAEQYIKDFKYKRHIKMRKECTW